MKKLTAILCALVLVLSLAAVPTVAEANGKILAWCSFPLDPMFEDGALKNSGGVYEDVFDGLSYQDYTVEEAKADSFYVFNFPKAEIGDVHFELPQLPEHYYWDTANFKNGYLHVRYTSSSAIMGIASGETVHVDVFATNGAIVASYVGTLAEAKAAFYRLALPKGVYILRFRGKTDAIGSMTLRK